MKYNLAHQPEYKKALAYFEELAKRNNVIELKRIDPHRTLNQNSYLHLIIAAFGNFFGYTPGEAKMVYKHVNADLYRYKRAVMVFYRSSSDLTTEEMACSISAFKDFSNEHGFPLPDADNHAWLRQTENELERAGRMG